MTGLEWISLVVLISAIAIAFCIFIYGVFKVSLLGVIAKDHIGVARFLCIIFGFLVVAYLLCNRGEIEPGYWVEISLMAGLVGVTVLYASATFIQAKANRDMAEETKKQTLALHKPHIILEMRDNSVGQYFVDKLKISIANVMGGPAINLEIFIEHPLFEFSKYPYPYAVSLGQAPIEHEFRVTETDTNDKRIEIAPVTTLPVIANYDDADGNHWHTILQLMWKGAIRNVVIGQMEVAHPGRYRRTRND